ncbi:hypothetical protein ACKKBF_B18750 [Auxenochlorella protothecoides x Auxenochlorella symbiontica]
MVATRSRGSESEEPAAASGDAFMEQLLQGMSSALGLAPRNEVEDAAGPSGSAAEALEHAHLKWRPDLRLPVSGPQEPMLATRGVDELTKQLTIPPLDSKKARRAAQAAAPDTSGKSWFDMPATRITEEVKRDLRMLRLRSAFDPKAFYKKFDNTKFPKYFQMGTVVEGAADFYSSRLTNSERKQTFAEEIGADPRLTQARLKRYGKMQEEKSRFSRKGRKTDNPRLKKKPRRPKH